MQALHEFTPYDRLGFSALGSILIHMIVILGITFAVPKLRELQGLPTLEITLVQTRSDKSPLDPDFLAQTNQDGGGNSIKPDIARNPLPVREVAEHPRPPPAARAQPQPQVAGAPETKALLTDRDNKKIPLSEPLPEKRELRLKPADIGLPTLPDTQERARLNAEVSRFWQEYQKLPKRKYLNARTQEYKYAAYMDAWRAKVEQIGNLNYPPEARQRRLSGNLVLDVALNYDGSVHEVTVRRSSGYKLIDDAAIRIVDLATPFAPFPPEIRSEVDILHITRTWKFNDTGLSSEN